jgi:hypothetical protein
MADVNPIWGCECPYSRHAEDCAGYVPSEEED